MTGVGSRYPLMARWLEKSRLAICLKLNCNHSILIGCRCEECCVHVSSWLGDNCVIGTGLSRLCPVTAIRVTWWQCPHTLTSNNIGTINCPHTGYPTCWARAQGRSNQQRYTATGHWLLVVTHAGSGSRDMTLQPSLCSDGPWLYNWCIDILTSDLDILA